MRRPSLFLLILLAACQRAPEAAQTSRAEPAPAPARAKAETAALRPVLVELFTSQGCAACPPADEFLGRLARERQIVAISRPVTSWDRLGWRDTFGREQNTALQAAYGRRHGEEGYMPQAVVQGRVMLVGGREGAVHRAIDEYRAAAGPAPRLRFEGGAVLLDGAAARPAEIRLLALRGHARVPVGRGENHGMMLDYVNIVVAEGVIGSWRGGPLRLKLAPGRLRTPGADRYAVIVQEPDAGEVLTAGFLPS
ncbi:MAG TPA: DUF1223 domain-containing protein [Allosphingosinicella sp.]|nr:DUF1223 domain-containing protein [Allosphingosinicella sp.]